MVDTLTFAVPVEWSKTTAYEQNIIVFVGKRAYTSLKAVPTGIEITDTSYWAETGVPKGSATIDAYTKAEVDEKLDSKATFLTRSDMDANLAQHGIATPLDYANAKNLMANAGTFYSDAELCANVLAMAEVINALCAQIDAMAHLAALSQPGFTNSLSSTMSGTGVKSVDERGGIVQVSVEMTVSVAIGGWTNFATGLPVPTRTLYWQGWSMTSAQSYKLRLDTTGALGVRTRGDTYIDTTLTYIAAD